MKVQACQVLPLSSVSSISVLRNGSIEKNDGMPIALPIFTENMNPWGSNINGEREDFSPDNKPFCQVIVIFCISLIQEITKMKKGFAF